MLDALLKLLFELLGLYLISRQPLSRVLCRQTSPQLSYFRFAVTDVAVGSALQVGH